MKKLLIIEDEIALQKTLKEVFEGEGYKVLTASDGLAGFESAKKNNPDLVLLDIILPKMNGFEVLKKLKQNERAKNIPVIIVTNLGEAKDIHRALELGATTYLVKANYGIKELVDKIKAVMAS